MPKNRWNCCQVELAFFANDIAVCGVVAVFMGFDGGWFSWVFAFGSLNNEQPTIQN